ARLPARLAARAGLAGPQLLVDDAVGRLEAVVGVQQQGAVVRADPAVPVVDAPDGERAAARLVGAGLRGVAEDRRGLRVLLRGGAGGVGGRDVHLRDGDVEAEAGVGGHRAGDLVLGRRVPGAVG